MAFLYLKNIVFPSARYQPLVGDNDLEHNSALAYAGESYDLDAQPSPSTSDGRPSSDAITRREKAATAKDEDAVEEKDVRWSARLISNATIGFSDGLTVPFAVTAGLSAVGSSRIVIFGGMSELVAGTISMGMGGYLGAKGEADAYHATVAEVDVISHERDTASSLVRRTLRPAQLPTSLLDPIVEHLVASPPRCADFLMRFHHNMPPASHAASHAFLTGMVISGGYVIGGIVPLFPYLFISQVHTAFKFSIMTTAIVLFFFGFMKTRIVGEKNTWKCVRGGMEMFLLGGMAAGAAVGCVKMLK